MSAFNRAAGVAAKEDGIARAESAANPAWAAFMMAALVEVAKTRRFFYTDDIEELRQQRGGPATHENRAMGALMRRAKRDGICAPTNRFEPSKRVTCHRCPRRVWQSLLFSDPATPAS
jgi:hypothetical protein